MEKVRTYGERVTEDESEWMSNGMINKIMAIGKEIESDLDVRSMSLGMENRNSEIHWWNSAFGLRSGIRNFIIRDRKHEESVVYLKGAKWNTAVLSLTKQTNKQVRIQTHL